MDQTIAEMMDRYTPEREREIIEEMREAKRRQIENQRDLLRWTIAFWLGIGGAILALSQIVREEPIPILLIIGMLAILPIIYKIIGDR